MRFLDNISVFIWSFFKPFIVMEGTIDQDNTSFVILSDKSAEKFKFENLK